MSLNYKFTDLFDIPVLTELCQSFTDINGIVTALLDLEGNIHIATGWQDACTKFHRKNPVTSCRCTESDTFLAAQLEKGCNYNVYKCKNGLVDVAVPIIIHGEHIANFFTGQFFLEPPDIEFFKQQAREFGFDEETYVNSNKQVPVYSEEEVRLNMLFLVKLTQVMAEMGRDRLEKKQANQKLQHLASTDGLTSLYNRSYFIEEAKNELKRSARNHTPLQLVMIDVDLFKDINDRYGHQAGDCVLQQFSQCAKSYLRETDLISRYGGEEFCILLQNTDQEGALVFAERLRQGVEEMRLMYQEHEIQITISLGIASYNEKDSFHEFSRKADMALYKAKNSGRNRVEQYSNEVPMEYFPSFRAS